MSEENEWINNMSKLKNDFSQILYLIYYLYKLNLINKEQKLLLKQFVLLNKNEIFEIMNNLKKTKNMDEFLIDIKKLITETNINNTKIENSYSKNNKTKHLITISSNDEETNNEDIFLDDLKSPVNCIKKIYRKK